MNDEIRSIYADRHDVGVTDMKARYGMELSTCDDLLAMGFVKSYGVDIAKRADWLEKEIERMESKKGAR